MAEGKNSIKNDYNANLFILCSGLKEMAKKSQWKSLICLFLTAFISYFSQRILYFYILVCLKVQSIKN